jgi:glutathione S-transferase
MAALSLRAFSTFRKDWNGAPPPSGSTPEQGRRMKLYDSDWAPNPRRVQCFLAEKGVEIERIPVDLKSGAHKRPDFARVNPLHRVPVLELDDGTHIAESMAICRYLEELHPEPALFGRDAREGALVEMWNRRVELGLFAHVGAVFRHGHPGMAIAEQPQVPEWADANRPKAIDAMRFLDRHLVNQAWLVDEYFSIADITLLVAFDFMKAARLACPKDCAALIAWRVRIGARACATAR